MSSNHALPPPQRAAQKNWADEFFDWLDTLDVPPMTFWQKCLTYFVLFILVVVVITSMTGHFYIVALAFVKAVDGLPMASLTIATVVVVMVLEVIGVNTTMLALAVGYIYGRRFDDIGEATAIASAVAFGGVVAGCLVAYALGATVLIDW